MAMEELRVKLEEDEEDFRSCCEEYEEDELKEREDKLLVVVKVDSLDDFFVENSVKMYFKGVSVSGPGDSGPRVSGIGVVMERRSNDDASPIQIQKKLDFYVDESVADYLALLDGLSLAKENNVTRVFAFTDSENLYNQIIHDEVLDNPLLLALRQRVLEQVSDMENFLLKLVPNVELQKALHLAQVAIGVISLHAKGDEKTETCSICCEEKLCSMMLTVKCSHKFCSQCMKSYVEGKLQSTTPQVPIRCPQLKCKYCISASECKLFLPVTSYESLEKALLDANLLDSNRIYCPYAGCSVLLDPYESDNSCVECPVCRRSICVDCGVPWHSSMTCVEYQNQLPLEERDASDLTLHRLAQNKRWRRCQQCRRMIELDHGCYHMTCWCGHEFCYSCGAEYRDNQQTCQCAFWDGEDYPEEVASTYPTQQFEQWAWDSFESLPMMTMDAYSDQERSQLALIHRFLAGGFSLTDDEPIYQSPPRCTDSYADAMKDLHQLPWLERFVSVISDNYYEEYIQ